MVSQINWICNSPTPYNNFLFEFLSNNLDCEFLVHYLNTKGTEHADLLNRTVSYKWRKISNRYCDMNLFRLAVDHKSFFVIGGWNCLTYVILFLLAGFRYAFWTDTPKDFRRNLWLRLLRRGVAKICFARARAVLGTGAEALSRLAEIGAPKEKLIHFPCWVDVPAVHHYSISKPVGILAVGRLVGEKSFQHLVPLATELLERGVDCFSIKIVGDGPEYASIKALVDRSDLGKYISLTGWLDSEKVFEQIGNCDILLHPAAWEPYGVVILEAMARGKTVVCSDRTMAGLDRIDNQCNGVIYEYGDISGLADVIGDLIRNGEKLVLYGKMAYQTACDWKVERSLSILNNIINS